MNYFRGGSRIDSNVGTFVWSSSNPDENCDLIEPAKALTKISKSVQLFFSSDETKHAVESE